jgi:hypothetical protein
MKTSIHIQQYLVEFLRWEIFNRICRKNQNTHFIFKNFLSENRAVYEIMWKNTVELEPPQTTT